MKICIKNPYEEPKSSIFSPPKGFDPETSKPHSIHLGQLEI